MWILLFLAALFAPVAVTAQEASLLVLKGKNAIFDEITKGIHDELDGEIAIEEMLVEDDTKVERVKAAVQRRPAAILLVGNKAAYKYARLQKEQPDIAYPPSVVVAALFVEKVVPQLVNATGVRFEIPLVTSVVTMRQVFVEPVTRIGVIHREWMRPNIAENRKFLAAEGAEIVAHVMPDDPKNMARLLKKALNHLAADKVDAIWVVTDNALLTSKTLNSVWVPKLKRSRVPVLVGVEALAESQLGLGSVAVTPDLYGLGVQASSIIFDLMDNDWELEDTAIQQPIAVKKVLNKLLLDRRDIDYRDENLLVFDRVIKSRK